MAVGDLVATLAVPGETSVTYSIVVNPGGFFAIEGNNLVEAVNTPVGFYPITVSAFGPNIPGVIAMPFPLTYGGAPSTDGPMDFSVPGNIGITGALP